MGMQGILVGVCGLGRDGRSLVFGCIVEFPIAEVCFRRAVL